MTNVTVIHVGDFKEKFFADAEREYAKRLGAFCRFMSITVKEERIDDENSQPLIARALAREAEAIKKLIPAKAYVISLCVEGKKLSSEQFAALIDEKSFASELCFIIGSSHGLDDTIKNESGLRLSFSDMTFPHQLMRVVLSEQIYRAFTIIAGKKYHK